MTMGTERYFTCRFCHTTQPATLPVTDDDDLPISDYLDERELSDHEEE